METETVINLFLLLMGICVILLTYCWIMLIVTANRINKLNEQITEARFANRAKGERQ